jgi:signal transduction histidine kinase
MTSHDLRPESVLEFRPAEGRICARGGEQRLLIVSAEAMGALRTELVRTLGLDAARGVLARYGYECGRADAMSLSERYRGRDRREWLRAGPAMHALNGIVLAKLEEMEFDPGQGRFRATGTWRYSYEAEAHLKHLGRAAEPTCWTLSGYASGYASTVTGREIVCLEEACVGRGDACCRVELRPVEAWGERAKAILADLRPARLPLTLRLGEAEERTMAQAERMAAVGQLTASLAHEIGTPLNVISGNAEYLRSLADHDPEVREGLDVIVQQSDRIAAFIRQLLRFARPETQRPELVPVAVVLADAVNLLREEMHRGKVKARVEVAPDLPLLLLDPDQMQQVFVNLLLNAVHAMPDGGELAITARRAARRGADGGDPRGAVEVRVTDTGRGIAAEHLGRIFDPFFTTKGGGQGTGLGLAITRRIVEDHRGRVAVESRVGRGTTVTVTLPIAGGGGGT